MVFGGCEVRAGGQCPQGRRPGGAHSLLGIIYLLKWQYEKAIAEAKKAVALVPSNSWANGILGAFLAYADRPDEAVSVSENALRLNPFPTGWELGFAGIAYHVAGSYKEALACLKKGQERNPRNIWSYIYQAGIYGHIGRAKEARAAAKELLRLSPKFSVEHYEKTSWYRNHDKWSQIINGLRKAGLK